MRFEEIIPLAIYPVTAAIGWFAGNFVAKRKTDNDFLTEMQANIDMLVEKYSLTLKELILMKQQNAELLLGQQGLENELKALQHQNTKLKSEVDKLTGLVKKAQKPVQS